MTPQDQQQQTIQSVGNNTVREQDKIHLVLAYLGLWLIPLLTVKDSEFVTWHAKNALVLTIGGFILMSIISVVTFGFGACLAGPALLVICVMAMLKALKGERWHLPLVSDLAAKF